MYCGGLFVLALCFLGVWAVVPPKGLYDEPPITWTTEPPKRASATAKKHVEKKPPLTGRYLEIFYVLKEFIDKSKGRINFRELGMLLNRELNKDVGKTTKKPATAKNEEMLLRRVPIRYW